LVLNTLDLILNIFLLKKKSNKKLREPKAKENCFVIKKEFWMAQGRKEEWPWKDKLGDYSLVPVPKEKQRSLMSVFVVYTGVLACIAVLWAGGDLGAHFNLHDMLIVAIAGSAILALIGGLTAYIGGVSKCSTYVNIRPSFGRAGSWIWNIIISGIPAGIG